MQSARLAGRLLVVGFPGESLPAALSRALGRGERGGIIFFKRNLLGEPRRALALTTEILDAATGGHPPIIGVDQEGGRVARLAPPVLALPPARRLGALGTSTLRAAARRLGEGLASLGITTPFAPVLDVDSRAENPVIGDRSFAADPARVAAATVAFAEGLRDAGVFACGKHFPGHGDTTVDSHLALPYLDAPRDVLDSRELAPFRAAIASGIPSLMSAHVVVRALDPERPATRSRRVLTELLRSELGFEGVLFSDDLEMGALGGPANAAESAVLAVAAGCDALLVCSDEGAQGAAFEALTREIERSGAFRRRAEEAYGRLEELTATYPSRPSPAAFETGPLSPTRAAESAAWLEQAFAEGPA